MLENKVGWHSQCPQADEKTNIYLESTCMGGFQEQIVVI